MAGLGRKVWTNETLSQPDFQGYVQDQVVMAFATAAARAAAVPAPTEGMVSYLADLDRVDVYSQDAAGALGWQQLSRHRFPRLQAVQSTAQTGLGSGWRTILCNTEEEDTHGAHNPATGVFTVPTGEGGPYEISGAVAFANVAAGQSIGVQLLRNGASFRGCIGGFLTVTGANQIIPMPDKRLTLAVGDTLVMQGFQNAAGWATMVATDGASWWSVRRVS